MFKGRTVFEVRKVRVRLLEWEFGSEAPNARTLWETTVAALKLKFKSVKFGLLLLCCAAIKSKI